MILPKKLLKEINQRGISEQELSQQILSFVKGGQSAKLIKAATVGDGIVRLNNSLENKFVTIYNNQQNELKIHKFTPASGMATRMFRDLLEFYVTKTSNSSSTYFFNNLHKFPFFKKVVIEFNQEYPSIKKLNSLSNKMLFLNFLLNEDYLNYKNTPKGLIKFHQYDIYSKSAVQEQIDESIEYALGENNTVNLHFTVTPNHMDRFQEHVQKHINMSYNDDSYTFNIEFSIQKPSTDTLAVNMDNSPYTDESGNYLFRAGGHGALIENLNDIDSDIIFIKNIDNVCHENHMEEGIKHKQVLAGVLLDTRTKTFEYLKQLESNEYDLAEILQFIEKHFHIKLSTHESTREYLIEFLNKPIRVCGMILNQGDKGGGPFWVEDDEGEVSLQIVESAQIDKSNSAQKEILLNATHFNPVDIVCSVKDYQGNKFDLRNYIDHSAYFIAIKSVNGQNIKGLERPGLWNGAMAKWLSIFVEVPLDTFSPVKSVTDLLNPMHQA